MNTTEIIINIPNNTIKQIKYTVDLQSHAATCTVEKTDVSIDLFGSFEINTIENCYGECFRHMWVCVLNEYSDEGCDIHYHVEYDRVYHVTFVFVLHEDKIYLLKHCNNIITGPTCVGDFDHTKQFDDQCVDLICN